MNDQSHSMAVTRLPRQSMGWLNPDSRATAEDWGWGDFSEAIEYLATSYASTMPLFEVTGKLDPNATKKDVVEMLADWENGFNGYLLGFGGRDELWNYLTWSGSNYLDRVCRGLVQCAYVDAHYGIGFRPYTIGGLADYAYPIIYPIIDERVRNNQLTEVR